ncbi:DNA topology modulation protein [Klebsiella pneumoniae]|nr:DNA topology modulation protein [Klebsiella pneumoniae]
MNINVVGTSGSGKSTLARRLAHRLELPWIELDRLYWRPNWQGAPDEAFFAAIAARRPRRAGCWMAITIAAAALNGVRWIW